MNKINHKKKTAPRIFQGSIPPPGPPPPFGSPPFFGPPLHFGLPLPMTLECFKEMKYMMILMILSDNPKGITGYKLQKRFQIPRGNLLRTLDELVEKNYLTTSESLIKGRAQKFFIPTKKGKKYLNKLRKKWITRFSMMADMGPPSLEGLKMMLTERIKEFESKEDAIDFFRGVRSWMKNILYHIEIKTKKLTKVKDDIDIIIDKIELMDLFDNDKIINFVMDSMKKFEEEVIIKDE